MSDERNCRQIEKLKQHESDIDEKMDYIIYELKILLLNVMIDVLEKLNETNEDQMRRQTSFTCI